MQLPLAARTAGLREEGGPGTRTGRHVGRAFLQAGGASGLWLRAVIAEIDEEDLFCLLWNVGSGMLSVTSIVVRRSDLKVY